VKHYEICESIYDKILNPYFKKELPSYFNFYNNYTTLAFFGIEKNGIKFDRTTVSTNILTQPMKYIQLMMTRFIQIITYLQLLVDQVIVLMALILPH
jgi:hypothetical protein